MKRNEMTAVTACSKNAQRQDTNPALGIYTVQAQFGALFQVSNSQLNNFLTDFEAFKSRTSV